jgi:uncharacterized surface protein with fasciclin (FAS1) repeats
MLHRSVAVATLVAFTACSGAKKDDAAVMDSAAPAAAPSVDSSGPKDIIETATTAGSFGTLAKALEAAGLVETLKGSGPYTVLAPTDEAFAKIPAADLDKLMANKAELTRVLTYHVIAGNVPSAQVTSMTEATTLEGSKLEIKVVDGRVMLNGKAAVTSADIPATNGVIHVIDTVLMPPKKK